MNTKEYLQQVNSFEEKIEKAGDKLARLRSKITKVTSAMSGDVVSASKNPDKMTDTADNIEKTKIKMNSDADAQFFATVDIVNMIATIENPNHRRVLYKKYIQMKSWGRIAFEMGYTYRGIINLHDKAVIKVGEKIEENKKSIDCSYQKC